MTVESEVAALTTAVDNLTAAVNVQKATLDTAVANAAASATSAQTAKTGAETAQAASETAQGLSEDARDASGAYATASAASALAASQSEAAVASFAGATSLQLARLMAWSALVSVNSLMAEASLIVDPTQGLYLTKDAAGLRAFHNLEDKFDSAATTPITVRDSDGKFKNAPHRILPYPALDNAAWTRTGIAVPVADGVGPHGLTAYRVTEDGSTGAHALVDAFGTAVAGAKFKVAIDVEAGDRDVYIDFPSGAFGTAVGYLFDTTAGTKTQVVAGTNDGATITPISSTWWRIEMWAGATAAASFQIGIYLYNGATSYAGDGSSSLRFSRPTFYRCDMGGMQPFSNGTDFDNYTDGARYYPGVDYDPTDGKGRTRGWEGRTNLLTKTSQFDDAAWAKSTGGTGSVPVVTANDAVGPDGQTSADKVVFDAGAGTSSSDQSIITQIVTVSSATEYSGAIWIKGAVGGEEILLRHAANSPYTKYVLTTSWQRIAHVETSATTATYFTIGIRQNVSGFGIINSTATVYLWGADLQPGGFDTPHIPTYGAAGIRSAHSIKIDTDEFDFNPDEGTLIVAWHGYHATASAAAALVTIGDSPLTDDWFLLYITSANSFVTQVYRGSSQAQIANPGAATSGKAAAAYKADDFAASLDGATALTDTSGSVPSGVSELKIGAFGSNPGLINGDIEFLAYIPSRKANAILEAQAA